MNLAVITATRGRPRDLLTQAELLGKQLGPNDQWVVVEDNQADVTRVNREDLEMAFGRSVDLIRLSNPRQRFPGPNRAKRIGHAAAIHDRLVELDDHDFVLPDTIGKVRKAFDDGAELIYGWCWGWRGTERMRPYTRCGIRDFPKGNPCIGLRAYSRDAYRIAGGWPDDFPAGDYVLVKRIELVLGADPARIVCIQSPLVVHGDAPDSIRRRYQSLRRRKLAK